MHRPWSRVAPSSRARPKTRVVPLSAGYPANPQPISTKSGSPSERRCLRLPGRGVEVAGIDRALAGSDQPRDHPKYPRPDDPLESPARHLGREVACRSGSLVPSRWSPGSRSPGTWRCVAPASRREPELVQTLSRARPSHPPVDPAISPERDVFLQPRDGRARHRSGLAVQGGHDPRHAARGVTGAAHRLYRREGRVAPRASRQAIPVAGNEEHPVLRPPQKLMVTVPWIAASSPSG